MLTNCLAACAYLTITVSESEIERDIGRKSSIFHTPFYSTPPLGRFPSEYRHPIWCGKTNSVATGWWKKFEDIFIRFRATHERDGQTDGRTPHHGMIYRAYAYASRGKNEYVSK